jgi:stage III sporulation protein AG
MNYFQQLLHRFKGDMTPEQRKKMQWQVLVLVAVGVVLMLGPKWFQAKPSTSTVTSPTAASPIPNRTRADDQVERQLVGMIARLPGVNGVDVMVTYDRSEQLVVEQNKSTQLQQSEDTDATGKSKRTRQTNEQMQTVFQQAGSGQTPVVLQTIAPTIRGIIVIAGGAEHASIKYMIVDAIHRGLNVPYRAISVLPAKSNEEE